MRLRGFCASPAFLKVNAFPVAIQPIHLIHLIHAVLMFIAIFITIALLCASCQVMPDDVSTPPMGTDAGEAIFWMHNLDSWLSRFTCEILRLDSELSLSFLCFLESAFLTLESLKSS